MTFNLPKFPTRNILFLLLTGIISLYVPLDIAHANWITEFAEFEEDDFFIADDSYWDEDEEYFVLTEAAASQAGRIFNTQAFSTEFFVADFDIRIGGGNGADGASFAWVPDYEYEETNGGSHNFTDTDGYGVEFDCYTNGGWDPNGQHIGLMENSHDTHLETFEFNEGEIEDNEWHHVTVINENGAIEIYWDDDLIIEHEIEDFDGFEGYFGFTAATGGLTNWHVVDNVEIVIGGPEMEISEESVEFDAVAQGDTTTTSLELYNNAEGEDDYLTLEFMFEERIDWLEVDPVEGELSASDTVVINFTAYSEELEIGMHEESLELTTNDLDDQIIEIPITIFVTEGFASLFGTITDAETELPIEGASIRILDFEYNVDSDEEGRYRFNDLPAWTYNILVEMDGYLAFREDSVVVENDEDIQFDFALLHAEFRPSTFSIIEEVESPDTVIHELTIENTGNGPLQWQVDVNYPEVGIEPMELLDTLFTAVEVLDDALEGVVFDGANFLVSGDAGDEENLIYVLDREGNLERSFEQPGVLRNDLLDLTWDGELIWGCSAQKLYSMTVDGDIVDTLDAPWNPSKFVAWDPDRQVVWVSGTTTDLQPVNLDGEFGERVDRHRFRITGLAYWQDDPDGYPLYVSHELDNQWTIHKIDPETSDTMFVAAIEDAEGGGTSVTPLLDPESWSFLSISKFTPQDGGDRIEVRQLGGKTSWIELDPTAGVIEPDSVLDLGVNLYSKWLPPFEYAASLVFTHDGATASDTITVDFEVLYVEPQQPPSAFNLLTPENGDTIVIDPADVQNLQFSWEQSIDPNPEDVVSYLISFSTEILESPFSIEFDDTTISIADSIITSAMEFDMVDTLEVEWWVTALSDPDEVECDERFLLYLEPADADTDAVEADEFLPVSFGLHEVYPNPFNSSLSINFGIETQSDVSLQVFDLSGRRITYILNRSITRGNHRMNWNADGIPTGVYLIQLTSQDKISTRKVLLLR